LHNRGLTLYRLKKYDEAIASYNKVLEIKPDFDAAWYNRACCHAVTQNFDQAIKDLQRAIELEPQNRERAKTDCDFDTIREDERFKQLIAG
jgi:tetratricopeptide (TPR) repeat protein